MATKEDILTALTQLDSGDNGHWTDDGLPRVDVIQTIMKDPTVTRKDIKEAALGFARATTQTTEPEDVQPGDLTEVVISAPVAAGTDLDHEDGLNLDPKDPLSDVSKLTEEQLRTTMTNRITAAQTRLEAAHQATLDAVEYERKCVAWSDKAKLDFNRVFPPMHPADAIKAHLKSQLDQRYLARGMVPPGSQAAPAPSVIDALMQNRKKQGRVYQQPAAAAAR